MIAGASHKAGWAEQGERGNPALIRIMAWLSCALGRGPSRLLLRPIVAYFVAFGGGARQSAHDFLARALGRKPSWADLYRVFFHFGATLHDRIFFLRGRFDIFDVTVHGKEHFGSGGALLMGAHLGSFEALRACGHAIGKRPVVMAMYEENARKINAVLGAIAPDALQDIVALGHVQSMLELSERLEAGAYVGILADRTLGDETTLRVDFLGSPAPFPTGPMRMAAALRQPVFFMAGLYLGANRYEIHFEPLADFSELEGSSRGERDARIEAAVRAYARCLERFARRAPYDWFNFHDFWRAGA
jgi:predicted LPLAT superfamily acyltransferase